MISAAALSPTPGGNASRLREHPAQDTLPLANARPLAPVANADTTDPHTGAATRSLQAPAARFLQAVAEVVTGARPLRQLSGFMDAELYGQLALRLRTPIHPRLEQPGRGARVVSVRLSLIAPDRAETCARMVHRGRSRALAARLELRRTPRGEQRWMCTALEWA